jgi:teichuronic acid biosynthesis glycosyltransferase TuaC
VKRLVVITKEYPSPGEPVYPFVEQLVNALADLSVQVTVISPLNPLRRLLRGGKVPPAREVRRTGAGSEVLLLRPRYISFGGRRTGPVNPAMWTLYAFYRAVARAVRSLPEAPEALYGHFVFPSGLTAASLGAKLGIPAFLAYGESTVRLFSGVPKAEVARRLRSLAGVVAVSGENAREIVEDGYYPFPERVRVFPNAVDPEKFRPMDRRAARARLGLPQDEFIVAFVGGFIERKGVRVLSQALDAAGASSIFIGRGELRPTARDVRFCGAVDHDEIPLYLAAADIFALPTLNEGCCNAIVEALAMGLPVVSSDRPFNDGLLTEENSLRVDPTDTAAVAAAIAALKRDPELRAQLAAGARRSGEGLRIDARAKNILKFMEDML